MVLINLPNSKEEAKKADSKCYFTGIKCANGHLDKRYTNTGICYACKRDQTKRNYQNNKETVKNRSKRYCKKNRVKVSETSLNWAINNREKSNRIKKQWKIRNRDKYLKGCRDYVKKKRQDPFLRLSMNTSKGIWESLKKQKGGRHWENLVDFTLQDLTEHLEKRFSSNMNWENYGSYWELDHVKPISLCKTFEECWKLENLQPLTCFDNRSKGNRYVEAI